MADVVIRRAEPRDVPALLNIYNHYVCHSHVTFDVEPRTLEQRQAWFASFGQDGPHQCFVAASGADAIGWACSSPFKERAAYATSVETSVYLAPGEAGKGFGRRLYETMFDHLSRADVHRAYGGISLPNEASVRLHRNLGFVPVGTYREVGRKFGRFWDVVVYEKALVQSPSKPGTPLL